ncbi:MAG: nucleotidyltransferase family protein, partial [Hyphomicrobiales bacterium]
DTVVNVHYKADKLQAHLKKVKSPKVVISDERGELLETGGGVAKALSKLGDMPFFVVNTDSLWTESTMPALTRLKNAWDDETMDGVLLLAPTISSLGYSGSGDFNMDPGGNITRRGESKIAPFVFTGAYILHPRLFKGAPTGKFSMNLLFDKAIKAKRLKGVRHDSLWIEINTPEAVETASAVLADL